MATLDEMNNAYGALAPYIKHLFDRYAKGNLPLSDGRAYLRLRKAGILNNQNALTPKGHRVMQSYNDTQAYKTLKPKKAKKQVSKSERNSKKGVEGQLDGEAEIE